ncbi:GNAT family N-acetyltransferase [candidate division KSB1 bacterium]|nr:GNAT family N-acetyltransferase [candidate division KSB1 bacterium]
MMKIEYIKDAEVDDQLDRELRYLLSACFIKAGDEIFKSRRFYKEPPAHRWYIHGEDGQLIAHTALHEKMVETAQQKIPIGGIAEVCVLPEFRGCGLVRSLLKDVHHWLTVNQFPFAVLFGNPQVYSSSGYFSVSNLYLQKKSEDSNVFWEPKLAMVCRLSAINWPEETVYLHGPDF